MGRIKTIARRSFLVGSVAVVGGVAFGAYKLRQTPENPLTPSYGSAALNPFVIIDMFIGNIITLLFLLSFEFFKKRLRFFFTGTFL